MCRYNNFSLYFIAIIIATTSCLCFVQSFNTLILSNQNNRHTKSLNNLRLNAQNPQQQQQQSILITNDEQQQSRRSVIGNTFKTIILGTIGVNNIPQVSMAEDAIASTTAVNNDIESVYFGVGCFWHIQHEFIVAEKVMLLRKDNELTSRTGYAGGKQTDKDGRVCYHNLMSVADYGKYGHGEVVGMDLPSNMIVPFSEVYFSLFNPKTKDRVDPGDRGGEYRSLIGLPGGINHPLYKDIENVATKAGFTLILGKGNDPDTLKKQIIYIHDTKEYPFYQAELYHQYHDDFQSPPYGKAYNKLADSAFNDGRIKITGCPDRV